MDRVSRRIDPHRSGSQWRLHGLYDFEFSGRRFACHRQRPVRATCERQVAINLVSNAIKFTEKGGVTIRCHQIKQGEMVNVSVHDTGIGISPAALGYIFEAFRQADGSTTRQFGGTGLGLTIARKLIELQGGEVAVESAPGQGTTFSFTLPVAPALANIAGVR